MSDAELILIGGLLLAAGIAAAMVADRLRVPGLVLFLGLGMLIGEQGPAHVEFDDVTLTRTLGTIGLLLILFEGGLTAGWKEIRPVLGTAVSLATIGTLVTAVAAGLAAKWLFDLPTLQAMIVGSAVAATDSAAIFAVLRGSTLRKRLARSLEGESGMNDPVALLLVTGFISWIQTPGYNGLDMAGDFVLELAVGAALGVAVGLGSRYVFRRARLPDGGPVPGRLDRDDRHLLRARRPRPRFGLPRRLPHRPDPRHGDPPRAAHDHRLPPGPRLGRPDLALLPARAARHARARSATSPSRASRWRSS